MHPIGGCSVMNDKEHDKIMKEVKKENEKEAMAIMRALYKAQEAFYDFLETTYDYDGAFFDICFTAWELTTGDFKRVTRYEIEHEVKDHEGD